ncbi:putative neprosin [Tanacetum coccineum]
MMQSSFSHEIASVIFACIWFSLLFLPIFSSTCFDDFQKDNGTFMPSNESKKMRLINTRIRKINKPFAKSIKSPDGDIIDCVLYHLQPAFDHPELKGKMSLSPPELPKEQDNGRNESQIKQLWSSNGESCPNGTIPVKRTSASNIFRSDSITKFGKRFSSKDIPIPDGHEHAVGYVTQGEYYGAKALLNVWAPNVVGYDFSISQIWVMADILTRDVNTVEAGWHAYPNVHKDNIPRLFTYWTHDGYRSGCYNLECPGFIQTNSKVCLGAAIDPLSTYDGQQYDLP